LIFTAGFGGMMDKAYLLIEYLLYNVLCHRQPISKTAWLIRKINNTQESCMAYNPETARAVNELVQQGYTPEAALRQIGVPEDQFGDYTVNEVGTPETNPNFGQVTDAGYRRVNATPADTAAAPNAGYSRDPETGALRIEIFGVADESPNDDVTTQPPDQQTPPVRAPEPAPIDPTVDPQFGLDDDTPTGGIRGPVDGISPYGEPDGFDETELQLRTTPAEVEAAPGAGTDTGDGTGGIRGPVDGISPYGDPDDFEDINAGDIEVAPATGDATGYGSGYDIEDTPFPEVNTGISTDPQAGQFGATIETVRSQAPVQVQTRQVNQRDWRVRLSLAPGADYLYKAAASGDVLWPLRATDGVLFPYTPQIQVNYQTNYAKTPLTHSNYQGLFYQSSLVSSVSITADFTAQDTSEANYLLAALHFFRSAGKMFYGQDSQAGAPPPLLYLSGFGEYQFMEHTLVLENFNYTLPQDVDYIRARSANVNDTNLLRRRDLNVTNSAYDGLDGAIGRLGTLVEITKRLLKITPGANPGQPSNKGDIGFELGGNNPTYVPTKMQVYLTLVPVQTRDQISRQFSLREFGRGTLLRKGYW
jgi:hypothetical protein